MSLIIKLFFTFLKIGTFSFGGGYAMIPFIQREIITNNNWINSSTFMDIIG
ncbi:MAG: chromate transporter, partial [Clostridium baratii]|nr:chromate transporter [Clostridium baratii]